MINTHIEDGVALTKFLYWIKVQNKKKITEIDAQNKLEKFRRINKNYLERYSRQIVLKNIGITGQKKISSSKLSEDAEEILEIALLTNSYTPKNQIIYQL